MGDGIAGAIGTGLSGIISLSLLGLFVEKTGELGDAITREPGLSEDFKNIDID